MHEGRDGRAPSTVQRDGRILRPVLALIGSIPLHALRTHDVRRALSELAAFQSSATVALAHNCLVRAIRHAEAGDHMRRNVAALVKPPPGQAGRPSRSIWAASLGRYSSLFMVSPPSVELWGSGGPSLLVFDTPVLTGAGRS
jgi:hypothetical protein